MSDELLKDRIVVGIINNEIRERLLSEADLNLEKATQICIACENATNQMKHVLSDSDKQVAVTKINSKKWEDRKEPRKENITNQSHKIIENCRNCGRSHKINQCPAYQKRCNKCKKLNHFANLCRSQNTNSYKVRQIVGSPEPEMIQEFVIQSVENTNLTEDWYEEVKIKGKKVNMKLDTGAQCNVLPLSLAGRLNLEIQRSPVKSLISFSGHRIPVEGQSLAMCMVKNMTAYIRFIISRDNTCPILGRQTCSNLGLVKRVNTRQAITQEYQVLFEGIGCLKGYEYEAKFQTSDMNMQVRPPRPIPLSIKERVNKELEEMEDNGIIKKVNYPTPISSQMVIAKQKGKIRICIDPSDIHKVILRSHFPLQTFDQIAVNLHGSKYFTKLDLKKGYWQIKVAPNSQRYFTFSTPWGRYMFLRVPFGIKTAPEIFQKIMADLLQDLEGTENSMDDILIHAPDPQTLEIRTRAVLQRLKENGIKLNRDKCKFQLQEVQFLGHIVTTEGIKIDPEKVRAIGEIKSPSNKQELQRLLGMVQYLSRFIPNLAEKTKNMRLLLKKDTPWLWDESLDCDLLEIKTLLRTAPTLKFFNPNGNLTLSVDASSYALGAVLLQNGKPIAYASSALNSTQQNYAQIEKEALAIKFGCDKFHQLIYGKTVDVETDHRPLETIFKKPLSKAPPRLQRIFLQIQQYDLRIKYKKGKELLTADLLSRDCSYEDTYLEENFEVLMTTPTNKSSYEELQALTKEDQELQELKILILYGWPNYKSAVPESCKKYWPYRDELSTNEDLIFKGSRVFIPLRWKAKILKLIHEGHQGTNSCLRRARDSIYWHGMSQDIINTVENCRTCQANQRNKAKEPMIIKEIPSLPWEIVAADIFSIKGKNYLLITDNYSGFIDFKEMKTMNSAETIESLKKWFSVHGIPRLLETDNGPNFTSRDFKDFQKKWLFDHQTSSPLYPKSNGLAERAVQTAKNLIRKCLDSGQEVELALLNFYNTPRDGLPSPAQCLFSRRTRTLLPTSTRPNVQRIFFNLPDEKENYEQTKMALDKYFTPHKNVVTERFKFRQRVQKDDESIDNYLISLRELSKSCEFGNLEADMIRDQIIEKCNNKKLKEKLLQQENLTLSKTIDIARMLEISRKEIRLLEPQNDQTLNRVQNKPKKHYNANNFNKGRFTNQGTPSFSGASKPKCYRCGLDTHSAQECGAKKMTCSFCNKLGHLFRACRNRPNQNNNRNHKNFNQTKVKTIQEENKTEVGESSDEYTYYTGAENKEKVQIDGSEINMIIDTGSDRTFISYNKMLELYGHKSMPKLHDTTRTFFAYGQDRPLPCYGYFNAVISWKENSVSEEIYVIDKKVESLLGGKASFELGIIKRVNHVNESLSTIIETLVQEHEHLFHGLGTIKGYSHKVTLKDNYRPISQRCRRIPYAMVEAVNQELDKMLENGIIEEVHQGSEWVSNIIVVPKRDSEEIRLCIDLREVNKAILRERHPIPTIDNMLHALKGAEVFAKLDAKKRALAGVICYLDDVVVYAKDRQELEERLRKVLQRFDKVGIRLNRNKCKFAMEELDILGHIVGSEDIFSRQPLSNTSDEKWLEDYVHKVLSITSEELQGLSLKEIKVCTEQDPLFQKLKDMVQKGVWPYPLNEEFKCFYKFKDELSIFDNLILKGSRILLPSKLIKRVLRIAHETHQGMTRTKQLLREKYFWINMDFDIENLIRNCPICVRNQPLINDQPLQIVPLPSKPWMKLGIDIVGPIGHHYVLTVIDYYSSYPEAMIIEDISSKTIIKKLMEIFARHGYPHEVVTDNGLQFVSTSMERFLKECGIRHIKASPYYPKSNGKIERFHIFLKKQFNSSSEEGKDWKEDLSRILMSYRTTPNRSAGKTPAFLLFSREIKTKLSSLVNDAEEDESNIKEFNMVYKEKMKTYNDIIRKASPHNFEIGNLVYVANPNNGKLDSNFRSEHHVILENTSINSFKLVNTKNGKIIHRNAKHLKHVPTQETNQGISDLIPEESQENLSSDSTRIEHLNSSDVQIPDDNSSNQDKDTSLNRPSSSRTGSTFNPVVSDRLNAEALHQLPPE
ncbi:K02A2.6-like, partial [Cordylochernes scorpioides]